MRHTLLLHLISVSLSYCLCLIPGWLNGQATLSDKLAQVSSFEESIDVLKQHYDAPVTRSPGEPKEIHMWRWAYEMSSRLGPNGEFVNISERLMRASKQRASALETMGRISVGAWTFVGPVTTSYTGSAFSLLHGMGRVDRLAFHPSAPGTFYAATPSGGLWKTTNDGASWTCLTSHLPSIGIGGIVVSYADPNVIYILTGDGDTGGLIGSFVGSLGHLRASAGVFKSVDGGINWTKTGVLDSLEGSYGYELVQSPTNPDVLLAATATGLFRTGNGGITWTNVHGGLHHDVAFKPGDGSRVYTALPTVAQSFCYSTDGGLSWDSCSLQILNSRIAIATTPADPTIVYLLAGPQTGAGNFRGIYKSTNSGVSFTTMITTPNILDAEISGTGSGDGSIYTLAFDASPISSDTFITGSFICWRSIDGANSIQNITPYWEYEDEDAYVHPDIHDIQYNPLNGKLYAAGDGGVYRSINDGTTWTFISSGIQTTQFYHMSGVESDVNRLLGGCQDNGLKLRINNTGDFMHVNCCDGFDGDFDPENPATFIASINATLDKYSLDGLTISPLSPAGMDNGFFKNVLYHQTSGDTFFIGASDIWRTTNGGANFVNLAASGYWAMERCPSDVNRIYVAGGNDAFTQTGEVWRTVNLGNSWTNISDNPGFPAASIKVTDIGVNPLNALQVWVTFGGFNPEKVFYSDNGGNSWIDRSGSLPDVPVNSIAIDAQNNAYAGTDIGVYYRGASSSDWTPFYNGLPNVPVTDLVLNSSASKIRASTFGRGIWQSDVFSPCPEDLNFFVDQLSGDNYYEASGMIQVSISLVGGQETQIRMKAGNNVTLLPGFEAKTQNYLHIASGPCSTGIPD